VSRQAGPAGIPFTVGRPVDESATLNQRFAVPEETLFKRGTTVVRRLRLAPGEAMPWHRDPFHRVTVVLQGDALAIEYRDEADGFRFDVTPGQAGWDEPTDRVHRGVNVGTQPYEEIAVFLLDHPDAVPQPTEE
jgi:quercetin dioxygenase-like cupin family protein